MGTVIDATHSIACPAECLFGGLREHLNGSGHGTVPAHALHGLQTGWSTLPGNRYGSLNQDVMVRLPSQLGAGAVELASLVVKELALWFVVGLVYTS